MNRKRRNVGKVYSLSDEDFANLIAKNYTYTDCLKELGLSYKGSASRIIIKRRINELNISVEHFNTYYHHHNKKSKKVYNESFIKEAFVKNSLEYTSTIKKAIINNNLLEEKCSICGNPGEWNGKKLVLQLDHINGINNDNRLENLRFLCPNCHSQTSTFTGKNLKSNSEYVNNLKNTNLDIYSEKEHEYRFCEYCNKEYLPKNKKQRFCSQKCFKMASRKVLRPSYEQLQKDLVEFKNNICAIARKYNVSDNTIRHWIKIYKKDINRMCNISN